MPESPQLHVIIVGAGLAGLTAALILAPHHRVTVYERGGPDVATGGQGIIVAPNGVKILQGIGFEPARAGAVPIRGIRTYGRDGVLLEDVDMDLKQRFGADSWAMKRGDFRGVLGQMVAEAAKGEGMVEIVYGSGVVGLECDQGVVELEGGEKVKGDVVIVADGVHSRLRNTILKSNEYKAKKTGLTCYRIAVSTEDASVALGDLPPPHWWDPSNSQNNSALIFADDGSPRFITAYPIRNAEMFNLSCILRTDESTKTTAESWHADGDRNEMIETFSDFGEQVKRILSAATEVKVWELQDLEPLPTWTSGRVMLIGDAAHAMSPLQGQGANMSIEDAESLRLLTPDTRPEDVLELLKLAESVRRPRTAQVLAQTRASHSKFATVGERLTANLDFNCGYDGIHDALARQKAAAK